MPQATQLTDDKNYLVLKSSLTESKAGTLKEEESFRPLFFVFVLVLILLCFNFQGVDFGRNSSLLYVEWDKDVQPIRLWDRALKFS